MLSVGEFKLIQNSGFGYSSNPTALLPSFDEENEYVPTFVELWVVYEVSDYDILIFIVV